MLVGCQRHAGDPARPLAANAEAAILLLPKIDGDVDRRGSYSEKIGKWIAEQGYFQRAAALAAADPTVHGPSSLYAIAVLAADQGEGAVAQRLEAQASALASANGHGDARTVRIRAAVAKAAVGDLSGAERLAAAIPTPYDRQEALTGVMAQKIRKGVVAQDEAVPLATPAVTEAWCDASRRAPPERQMALLEKAAANARLTFPYQRPAMLVLCAQTAESLGWREVAAGYFQEADTAATALSDRIEDGPIEKAKVAIALAQAGQRDRAKEILGPARVGSRLSASFFQPPALARVAEGYWAAGDSALAEEVWLEAAQNAQGHVHPNARVINAIEIYLSHLRAGKELSPEVAGVLAAIERGEGGGGPTPLPPEVEEMRQKMQEQVRKEAKQKDSRPSQKK